MLLCAPLPIRQASLPPTCAVIHCRPMRRNTCSWHPLGPATIPRPQLPVPSTVHYENILVIEYGNQLTVRQRHCPCAPTGPSHSPHHLPLLRVPVQEATEDVAVKLGALVRPKGPHFIRHQVFSVLTDHGKSF